MYCRNCGAQLGETDERCAKCSFVKGYGTEYCGICGEKIAQGQTLCNKCGNPVKSDDGGKKSLRDYSAYKDGVKRLNHLSVIISALSLLLILTLVFVPIYKCKYEPQSITEIENVEDMNDLIEDGHLEMSFSLFDDMIQMMRVLFDRSGDVGVEKLLVVEFGIFALFEMAFAIVLAVMMTRQLIRSVKNIRDLDNATILVYDRVRRHGSDDVRVNLFRRNTVISLVVYAGFDVLFTQIFSLYTSIGDINFFYRYMLDISGLSVASVLVLLFLVAIIVTKVKMRKEEDEINLRIIKENM